MLLFNSWNTITCRLLGPATCLSHKNGGTPISAFPKDTTCKLDDVFIRLSFLSSELSMEVVNVVFKTRNDSTKELNPGLPTGRPYCDAWKNRITSQTLA